MGCCRPSKRAAPTHSFRLFSSKDRNDGQCLETTDVMNCKSPGLDSATLRKVARKSVAATSPSARAIEAH